LGVYRAWSITSPLSHVATLERLAHELNVPVEAFLTETMEGEAGELLTLVRLWSSIEDTQGRRRVLSLARIEAERASYKESA
jgi:transcriptional regulator with XRE-family HTH domain